MDEYFINYILKLLSKYILSIRVNKNYIKLNIYENSLNFILKFLFLHLHIRFNNLIDIVCLDFLERAKRFELNYILYSLNFNKIIMISFNFYQRDIISSITNLFSSSN